MLQDTLTQLFVRDLLKLKTELEAYTTEDNIWLLEKTINNSAGNLVLHIVGNLNAFVGAVIGSLLLDRVNRKAYCALSQRADEDLIIEFCEDFEYTPVIFTANQTVNGERLPIYHTNVLMALGEDIAIICLNSIDSKSEKKMVVQNLIEDGKEIIKISEAQMQKFAGNMLQVKGANDKKYMVMSSAAYHSLRSEQLIAIENHAEILHSELTTIETCGGGSARCMMAEVFLPKV